MAGVNALCDVHIEVAQHGFRPGPAPDAEYPVLDVNSTSEKPAVVMRGAPGSSHVAECLSIRVQVTVTSDWS